jgi:hypothetical protein
MFGTVSTVSAAFTPKTRSITSLTSPTRKKNTRKK